MDDRAVDRRPAGTRAYDPHVLGQEFLDVAVDDRAALGQQEQVVADAGELRDHVRRQDDRHAAVGDLGQQLAGDRAPRYRVEVGQRFVQE